MFSFQIGATSQEEGEEAASAKSVVLFDEVKAKLQETLQFLHQDIGQLVKNAKPIPAILEDLEACCFHRELSRTSSQGSKATRRSHSARRDHRPKRQIDGPCGVSLRRNQVPE